VDKGSAGRLALGTAQFGMHYGVANQAGAPPLEEAKRILEFARSRGLALLDTAAAYGESERILGELGLDGWKIVTKIPPVPEGTVDAGRWVADSVDSSLRRLKIPALDAVLLHRPQQLLGPLGASLYAALLQLKRDRIASKIGISIYSPAELDQLLSIFDFDIVQSPFNLVDRRLLATGWMERLAERGVELHARSIFLQGLLLMSLDARPAKFARWNELWSTWHRWLNTSGATAVQACLNYVLSFSEIDAVVFGVDSLKQLQEILAAEGRRSPPVPLELQCADEALVNPSRWSEL
jgi:aryl-alcohol dehydrogenase-like predicted oxidoreductase